MAKNNKTNIGVTGDGNLKPEFREPTSTCNARLRYVGGYCQKIAGAGTDHEGSGRCKDHGGASGSGRPKQAFNPSEFAPTDETLKRFEQISESDPTTILNIDNEIITLRSIFYRYLKACEEKQKMPHPDDLKKYTDCLAKMVDIKNKSEAKSTQKHLTPNVFIVYVNNITNILRKHIQDPGLLNRIADELEGLEVPQATDEPSN